MFKCPSLVSRWSFKACFSNFLIIIVALNITDVNPKRGRLSLSNRSQSAAHAKFYLNNSAAFSYICVQREAGWSGLNSCQIKQEPRKSSPRHLSVTFISFQRLCVAQDCSFAHKYEHESYERLD